ncbi:MAG: tRNA (adenosine(37)-N6)-threonylcarbamoyltransferase complex ATPase subunit type 1 TsaE [bacterium]|nr:tRNA (adenosine(37)-N6)-threonylcarbamoyltransferase complex ATPase subunit type 1 TsaE [bacterium]
MIKVGIDFSQLPIPWVLGLCGDLGSGKTTFVKGLAQGLQCTDEVSSPTFGLIHLYSGPKPLIHCDWYRIETLNEIDRLGWYEILDNYDRIVVEWADKFIERLPTSTLFLYFTIEDQFHKIQVGKIE